MRQLLLIGAFLMSGSAFGVDNVLEWDAVEGAEGYNVYAKPVPCNATGDYGPIGSTGIDTTNFPHTVEGNGFNWCYKVSAFNVNGESGFSNEAGKVPAAPGALRLRLGN